MAKHLFKPGEVTNPQGRRKGSVNKFTTLKAAFLNVFERMGGEDGLLEWVNASNHNKAAFYQWITKMLPVDVKQSGEIAHTLYFDFGDGNGNGHE
jgi:hypothetical protein